MRHFFSNSVAIFQLIEGVTCYCDDDKSYLKTSFSLSQMTRALRCVNFLVFLRPFLSFIPLKIVSSKFHDWHNLDICHFRTLLRGLTSKALANYVQISDQMTDLTTFRNMAWDWWKSTKLISASWNDGVILGKLTRSNENLVLFTTIELGQK